MSLGGGGEALPPLVQQIKTDASQALSEQDKFVASTKTMADRSEDDSKRAGGGFSEIAKGVAVGQLAVEGFKAAMEGLRKVIEVGIDKVKDDAIVQSQLAAGIQSTGNAANVSVDGMNALAKSISLMSGQTDDSIAKTESLLLTFTNIKNVGPDKIFDQTTQAAADMAARMGGDASASAIQLGKALNDPIKGITALTRVGVSFSDQQKKMITDMVNSGNTIGAQKLILSELNKEFGGSAEAAGQTFPGAVARSRMALEDMAGSAVSLFEPAVLPVLNLAATAAGVLSDKFEEAVGPIKNSMEKVSAAFDAFRDGFKNGTDAIGSNQSVFAAFGAQVFSVFEKIGQIAKPILDAIGSAVKQLAPTFEPLIGELLKAYSSFSPLQIAFKALAPVIPSLIATVASLAKTLGGVLGKAVQTVLPILLQIAQMLSGELAKVVETLAPIIEDLAKSLGGLLASALQAIMPLVLTLAKFIGTLLQAVLPLISPILDLVKAFMPLLDPIIQLVSVLLKPLVDLLTAILDPVMQVVGGLVKFLAPAISTIVEGLSKDLIPIIKGVTEVLGGVVDFLTGVFTGNWKKAWSGIVQIFTGIWDTVKGVVEGAINGVIDLINGVIAGINGIASGIKQATGGAINISIGKIPHVSFDVGTNRVPGPTGSPLPAVVHGGEVVVSNRALDGSAPVPQRAVDAVHAQDARQGAGGGGGASKVISIVQHNHQHTDTRTAASELGWMLKLRA